LGNPKDKNLKHLYMQEGSFSIVFEQVHQC
jgi:hypothetical protein